VLLVSVGTTDFVPSGAQWTIESGTQRAVVVEVGGGLREYEADGWKVIDAYQPDEMSPAGAGATLVPWPNRIRDGRYNFGGVDRQLPLTEPSRSNASHGLLRWAPWQLVQQETDRVTVGATVHPQPGYPYAVTVTTTWTLGPDGLLAEQAATNIGNDPAPFGLGMHPYLMVDGEPEPEWELVLPATERLVVDDRGLPTERVAVDGTGYDFRTPRLVRGLELDTPFTGLERGTDGRATVTLTGPAGGHVELWVNEAYPWIQVFTADPVPAPRTRRSWAVEPMTCPPDAFNSGVDLVVLDAGSTWHGSWGLRRVDDGVTTGA
jgi:aldose 1-epimerase